MAANMYKLATACIVGLLAVNCVVAADTKYATALQSALAGLDTATGSQLSLAASTGANTSPNAPQINCAFSITNLCRSRKSFTFAAASKGTWGQLSVGTFGLKYGQTTGNDKTANPAYFLISRRIQFRNAGTASFCANVAGGQFSYIYAAKALTWAKLDGRGNVIKAGKSCAAVGGRLVGGYQKLARCGSRLVFTNC